ncbi:unnamed protein product, partial [Iphiclides podalirius]
MPLESNPSLQLANRHPQPLSNHPPHNKINQYRRTPCTTPVFTPPPPSGANEIIKFPSDCNLRWEFRVPVDALLRDRLGRHQMGTPRPTVRSANLQFYAVLPHLVPNLI